MTAGTGLGGTFRVGGSPGSSHTPATPSPMTFQYGAPDFSARTRTHNCFLRTFNAATSSIADQSRNLNDTQMNELEYYQDQLIGLLRHDALLQNRNPTLPPPLQHRDPANPEVGFNYTTRMLVYRNQAGGFTHCKFSDLNGIPGFAHAMQDLEGAVKRHCPMRSFRTYAPGRVKGNAYGVQQLQKGEIKDLQQLPTSFQAATEKAVQMQLPAGKDVNVFMADSNPNAGAKKLVYAEAFYTNVMSQVEAKITNPPPAQNDPGYAGYTAWKKCQEDLAHFDHYATSTAIRFLPNNPMHLGEAATTAKEVVAASVVTPEGRIAKMWNSLDSYEAEQKRHATEEYARDVGGLVFSTNSDSSYAIEDYLLYNAKEGEMPKREGIEDYVLKLTQMVDPDWSNSLDAVAITGYRTQLQEQGRADAMTATDDQLRQELQRFYITRCVEQSFGAFADRQDASIRNELITIMVNAANKTTELNAAQTNLNNLGATATLQERYRTARTAFGLPDNAATQAKPGLLRRAGNAFTGLFKTSEPANPLPGGGILPALRREPVDDDDWNL